MYRTTVTFFFCWSFILIFLFLPFLQRVGCSEFSSPSKCSTSLRAIQSPKFTHKNNCSSIILWKLGPQVLVWSCQIKVLIYEGTSELNNIHCSNDNMCILLAGELSSSLHLWDSLCWKSALCDITKGTHTSCPLPDIGSALWDDALFLRSSKPTVSTLEARTWQFRMCL